MRQIYLDYNATTPIAPSIQEAMLPFITEYYGNPSSTHSLGRACQEAIEDARLQVAGILGADSDEIIFTSGGTESIMLAVKTARRNHRYRNHRRPCDNGDFAYPSRFAQRFRSRHLETPPETD